MKVFKLFSFFSSPINHAEFVGLTSILVTGFFWSATTRSAWVR